MEALSHNNINDFLAVAGDFLNADPVNNSVHLTSADAAVQGRRTPTALISLHDNGTVVGAVTQMDGRPLHVAAMPPAAAPLVVAALGDREINEVTGTRERVDAFRTLWREGGEELYALRLYRLEDLVVPDVHGESRQATPADDDLITRWWTAFVAELDGLPRAEAEKRAADSRWMPAGHVVWQVDGVPVSWAASTTPIGGVSRVGPVYTPPEHRRHGYAAAATAAVSQWAYSEGVDHVVLTADLANSTANSVYQGIGFRAVSDWSEYSWA
ncbi:GNAT family N-acetyltransferase [Lentzea albidocapillata]|uniref:Predicted acetyltransferase, GNAT family n=1 Tax=Lentzea albidocapillata TaxID=40571 RepID=A0A1W2FE25_9PSEU|nr:GNAT family N-acetyltransferase [Lentzea albidocapillata]SMD20093.1 Predicted acetyltransferase, GNAT family [Lentzea albidocapillata]